MRRGHAHAAHLHGPAQAPHQETVAFGVELHAHWTALGLVTREARRCGRRGGRSPCPGAKAQVLQACQDAGEAGDQRRPAGALRRRGRCRGGAGGALVGEQGLTRGAAARGSGALGCRGLRVLLQQLEGILADGEAAARERQGCAEVLHLREVRVLVGHDDQQVLLDRRPQLPTRASVALEIGGVVHGVRQGSRHVVATDDLVKPVPIRPLRQVKDAFDLLPSIPRRDTGPGPIVLVVNVRPGPRPCQARRGVVGVAPPDVELVLVMRLVGICAVVRPPMVHEQAVILHLHAPAHGAAPRADDHAVLELLGHPMSLHAPVGDPALASLLLRLLAHPTTHVVGPGGLVAELAGACLETAADQIHHRVHLLRELVLVVEPRRVHDVVPRQHVRLLVRRLAHPCPEVRPKNWGSQLRPQRMPSVRGRGWRRGCVAGRRLASIRAPASASRAAVRARGAPGRRGLAPGPRQALEGVQISQEGGMRDLLQPRYVQRPRRFGDDLQWQKRGLHPPSALLQARAEVNLLVVHQLDPGRPRRQPLCFPLAAGLPSSIQGLRPTLPLDPRHLVQRRLPDADEVEGLGAAGPRGGEAPVRQLVEVLGGADQAVAGGERNDALPGDPQRAVQVVLVQMVQHNVQALQQVAFGGLLELVRSDAVPTARHRRCVRDRGALGAAESAPRHLFLQQQEHLPDPHHQLVRGRKGSGHPLPKHLIEVLRLVVPATPPPGIRRRIRVGNLLHRLRGGPPPAE
mmetsp:Transcript_125945/g.403257  ORF Transcript_125945/g.403257 Transcript_125945/m.403257 type:complete len:744 (+) Transcript_125945:734-2965(+)